MAQIYIKRLIFSPKRWEILDKVAQQSAKSSKVNREQKCVKDKESKIVFILIVLN